MISSKKNKDFDEISLQEKMQFGKMIQNTMPKVWMGERQTPNYLTLTLALSRHVSQNGWMFPCFI